MTRTKITDEVVADLAPLVGQRLARRIVEDADRAGVDDDGLRRIVDDVRAADEAPSP